MKTTNALPAHPRRHGRLHPARLATAFAVVALAACMLPNPADAATAVSVFPSPGTRYNLAGTQIAIRGVAPAAIGALTVVGSVTGAHTGRIAADSDGQGASFLPDKPFAAGETVTVSTGLNILGGKGGRFSFRIAHSAPPIPYAKLPLVSAGSNGVQRFRSRADLQPAALTVTENSAPASEGDIFVTPQFGPVQNGPMILDPQGNLVWFLPYPVATSTLISDFRVQNLYGQPVLTWWQGNSNSGFGHGEGVIFDRNYRLITTVKAANGLDADLHEFLVTPQGDAYIAAASPVTLPGVAKPTIDSVIQEIDIQTGLVLFEWHALDHVPTSQSYFTPKSPGYIFDPYHVNSILPDASGNLVVSMRDTSAVYDINHSTGAVIWTLGGKSPRFKMGPSTSSWGQHDAIPQPDGTITMFDDGGGPPQVHPYSRGLRVRIDTRHLTATLVREYDHTPPISANFEGSAQVLPTGNVFLGWGQQPYFSEDTAAGQQIFDAHFNVPTSTYRAYRFPWSSQPLTAPSLAVSPNSDGSLSLYASWNGATDVAAWQVLAGSSPAALAPVGRSRKRGFETDVMLHTVAPYLAVRALGASDQVLASSPAKATPAHIALYGRSVFVARTGFAGVPASCFARHRCHIAATVSAGRTVIARSGREAIAPNSAGVVYFQLSSTGQRLLRGARSRRLAVRIDLADASGPTAGANFNLVPFSTAGRGPRRGVTQTGGLRLLGLTDFVSADGVGGILAYCPQSSSCLARTTISAGRTALARTGAEFLGPGEAGYLTFSLTSAGRRLLAGAAGNQLGAHVSLSGTGAPTDAQVGLVGFS